MSSIQAGLFPDKVLLVVQGGVYLAALVVAHVLIVKPAIRLQSERQRRTLGKRERANAASLEAKAAEERWNVALRTATDEARKRRTAELAQGQAEAQKLLQQASDENRSRVAAARAEVEASLRAEQARLPEMVEDVVKAIFSKLGVASAVLVVSSAAALLHPDLARASAEGGMDVMDSVVWPYFQFILFALLVYFAGRRVIPQMLSERRHKLKSELAEAQTALQEAEQRAQVLTLRLASVEREVEDLRTRYAAEGSREREAVVQDANRLAEQMRSDSERVVKETLAQGREKLRKELLDLAIRAVEERLSADKLAELDVQFRKNALDSIKNLPAG